MSTAETGGSPLNAAVITRRAFFFIILVGAIDEEAAVYYMVSQVLGYQMKFVSCTKCGEAHLDKDFFAVTVLTNST